MMFSKKKKKNFRSETRKRVSNWHAYFRWNNIEFNSEMSVNYRRSLFHGYILYNTHFSLMSSSELHCRMTLLPQNNKCIIGEDCQWFRLQHTSWNNEYSWDDPEIFNSVLSIMILLSTAWEFFLKKMLWSRTDLHHLSKSIFKMIIKLNRWKGKKSNSFRFSHRWSRRNRSWSFLFF